MEIVGSNPIDRAMKLAHPTYQQLLKDVPNIKKYFTVELLNVPGEKHKLIKCIKHIFADAPLLMIMAGCHGEEPAQPLAFFKNYQRIAEAAETHRVNLVLYPLVNPWGFSRNKRLNRLGFWNSLICRARSFYTRP